MKICYKITTQNNKSLIVHGFAHVNYIPGEWVESPKWLQENGYHLTVFETLRDVKSFLGKGKEVPLKIWECETDMYLDKLPFMCDFTSISVIGKLLITYSSWPPGTKMVKRLKLLREINLYKKPWIHNW